MKKIILLALIFSFYSCAKLPIAQEPSEQEINEQAAKAYAELKSKSKLSTNQEWSEIVQRVAKRIEIASNEAFQWEAILIDSPEVNAWCMPGGKMAVYTGIMPVLQNEAALAAVMGHEVAHATLRHGKQRYARAIKGNMAGAIIGGAMILGGQMLCKTETCKLLTGLGGAAAGFAVAFFDRKFSREDEIEADKSGQIFMANAGYDPSEAPRLWLRMNQAKGGKAPPEWMSTHPSDERRRDNLNNWMGEAQKVYLASPNKHGLGENIN